MTKNLIISAHYDSAEDSVGANDNGSGVAAVLELARILKDTEMPYNVKFILFSGEKNICWVQDGMLAICLRTSGSRSSE